ncbi:MAG: polyphosphate polymerase domain-containing protein, partial [Bacteroidales bacterium]|nr:polyphosphate polymerase domain-containing protein [Bacteroidales bacterium]
MTVKSAIDIFQPISLKEMDAVKLMNRIDTKYVLSLDLLPHILDKIHPYYRVLEIERERVFPYNSLYYDTDNNSMYLAHHNGRVNRYKIRFRRYVSSDLCFLEIKYKIKGTRTLKHRTVIDTIETSLSDKSKDYIQKFTPFGIDSLIPKIHTDFSRITLVSKELTERVTIDLDLKFRQNGNSKDVGNVVIIELKRGGTERNSNLIHSLDHYGVYPKGFSKYCIGRALLENDIKKNNFKERILTINKINDGKYYYRNF